MKNDYQISFYKKLREKGDLAALYINHKKIYEIYYYKKDVYEIIFDKNNDILLEVRKMGAKKSE